MAIFYVKNINDGVNYLSEEESKHCAQVLRYNIGDEIQLFDGNGGVFHAKLTSVSKKRCEFEVIETKSLSRRAFNIHIAIAPTKNMDRMEWLIEKLSEVGADRVSLVLTKHSERKKIRLDRLEKKAIGAMKQSRNPYLLQIDELQSLNDFLEGCESQTKLIAHVDIAHAYVTDKLVANTSTCILIGPEGDFSPDELEMAKTQGFIPVSLGKNTLRTETAGLVACCAINVMNKL